MNDKALSQEPQCTEHPCLGTLCRYYKEPCEDAVSREAVLDALLDYWHDIQVVDGSGYDVYEDCKAVIDELSPVTQKSGKWILLDECANSGYYCSRCQKKLVKEGWSDTVKKIKFCPNCGCRMVEPQESE